MTLVPVPRSARRSRSSASGLGPSPLTSELASAEPRRPSATIGARTRDRLAGFGAPRSAPAGRPGAPPEMISTGELKKGVAIELDGELWQILDYHHIKMGRGSAQVRITLRNIKRGQTVERSFQAGTKWPRASMEKRPVQFLYKDGDDYHFMDNDSYDQFILTTEQLGETAQYMKDGMTLDRTSYQGETIGVELPVTVDLVVRETEPGFAGDTADRRPQAGDDRDRPRRHGPDLRRGGRHDPGRHPDRGVPDPGLSAGRGARGAGNLARYSWTDC